MKNSLSGINVRARFSPACLTFSPAFFAASAAFFASSSTFFFALSKNDISIAPTRLLLCLPKNMSADAS